MQHRDSAGPQAGAQEDLWAVLSGGLGKKQGRSSSKHKQGVPKGLVSQLGIYFSGRSLPSQGLGENQLWY